MDFLSGWLKSVILVILIAAFVDLLLPNQSMQRYVKTVISLFLLMTLLQPLLNLIQSRTELEDRLTAALNHSSGASPGMESLAAIQSRAAFLQAKQQEDAKVLVQNQVAELIKRKLEQSAEVTVRSVQVETKPNQAGQPVITRVSLDVVSGNKDAQVKSGTERPQGSVDAIAAIKPTRISDAIDPIRAVEPIRIGGMEGSVKGQTKETQGGTQEEFSPAMRQKMTQITQILMQDWQLKQEQITLKLDPAAGGEGDERRK